MRFTGWLWVAGAVWAGAAWGQIALPSRGTVLLPKAANLATDPPINVLQEYALNYQALKAGRPPVTLGLSYILAQSMLKETRTCLPLGGMAAFTEFSTSFQRLAGRTDSTMASNREVVLTSIARYSCADAGDGAGAPPAVPGYEMMSRLKGTYAETISPRKRTVLPGLSNEQAAAFGQFGDLTQRFRTDPAAPAGPGTIAARMADLQEAMKLPPEERKKAVDELNARYAKEKPSKVEQANGNQMSQRMIEALEARGQTEPKPLAFLQLLQEGEVYVDFYKYFAREGDGFGAQHYLAVISDSRGSRLVRLGPAMPIDTAVATYVTNTQDRSAFESSWKELQRLVIQPLLGALPTGGKMLWVSPDSDLFGLPFASLMLDVRADLTVTVVPSAYDFSRLAALPAGPPTGKALLVGDLAVAPGAPDVRAVALADITSELDGEPPLKIERLSGRDATLPNVMTGMRDAQYILFSTHGHWSNAAPGTSIDAFGSAGIELWGEDAGSADSVLTAADIVKIDLSRSDLVVLLACETAQGQAVDGQGSLGFQSAFMASGARSLLVALWRVPADASKELVRNFYSGLFKHHLSRAEALKQAQSALRSQPRFADPWNWAGWVLVGDPRPLPQ